MAEQIIDDTKFTGIRLPDNLSPTHYDLRLKPNLSNFTFDGEVDIEYSAKEDCQTVVLHALELKIIKGHVRGSCVRNLTKVTYSETSETATLEFDGLVFASGTIHLEFSGILNDKMKGFYRTKFMIDNQIVTAATSKFEPTDARRCIPCWDEPAIKATFSVSLVINPQITVNGKSYPILALSNTCEVERQSLNTDEVVVKFSKSPLMSTYLLAFIVGPFEAVEATTEGKHPVRVFAVPGKADQGKFALNVACKSLDFYEKYFDVQYPLPKMDLIAIPDFSSGAMENWGLVTYRETALLVDENNSSTANKQWVTIVVAHELAHQWFGNLVTMEWWTHLWLNEGFATFMEYLCADNIFPEYELWTQFATSAFNSALDLDSLHNSHPIEVPVQHPNEISEIFDQISYEKGASVIRMLFNYIGNDSFKKGMKEYLEKFAYKNAVTEDLWSSLEAASGKPVTKLMSGWTSQKGYPWLAVSMSRKGNTATLSLLQDKFSADGKMSDGDSASLWVVPIDVSTSEDPSKVIPVGLFDSKKGELTFELKSDGWVKLNPGTIGLYRVVYDDEMKMKLLSAINDQSLPAMDRLGYQNDLYSLCQAGKVNSVDLLKLLDAFKGENDYNVWVSIDKCLNHLSRLTSNTDYQDKFDAFGRRLLEKIFQKLTWKSSGDKKHSDPMLRALIINRLVSFNDQDVIQECIRLFKNHVAKTALIPADLRFAVYRAVSVHGQEQDFDNLFDIYHSSSLQEEKIRALRSLGSTKDSNRRQRVIKLLMSDAVRSQDKIFVVMAISNACPDAGWQLFVDHKDALLDSCGATSLKRRVVMFVTENFASDVKAAEIESYFRTNKVPGSERALEQSLERVRINSAWLERDREAMKEFLH